MKFTKMHGCGNDYVFINGFEEKVQNPGELAVAVSNRHFGIGSDGLILINPSGEADCEREMYNADGSRGSMCGNGIRCVAKYVYDRGLVKKDRLTVSTLSGVKTLDLTVTDGKVSAVRVDMGEPQVSPQASLVMGEFTFGFTPVDMGNPHAVLFLEPKRTAGAAVAELPIYEIGPFFETNASPSGRVNAEFVEVMDEKTLRMRVWERGSGETLACGTGACAAAVAAIAEGRLQGVDEQGNTVASGNTVTVELRGGRLEIEWDRVTNHVFMTGPAVTVFDGEF